MKLEKLFWNMVVIFLFLGTIFAAVSITAEKEVDISLNFNIHKVDNQESKTPCGHDTQSPDTVLVEVEDNIVSEKNSLKRTFVPETYNEIKVNNIIVFEMSTNTFVDTVVEYGYDELGWYCITKEHHSKIRFKDIRNVITEALY